MSTPHELPTAITLRQLAENGSHGVVLHRCAHLPDHDAQNPTACWCSPLVLDGNQMRWGPLKFLQQMLDEHFMVH